MGKIYQKVNGFDSNKKYFYAKRNAYESAIVVQFCPEFSRADLANAKFNNTEIFGDSYLDDEMYAFALEKVNKHLRKNFCSMIIQNLIDDRFFARIDGLDGELLVLKFRHGEYEQVKKFGEPSRDFYTETQHKLFVSGAKNAVFVAFNAENDMALCSVARDESEIEKIKQAWDEFDKEYPLCRQEVEKIRLLALELRQIHEQKSIIDEKEKAIKEQIKKCAKNRDFHGFGISVYFRIRKNGYDYENFVKDNALNVPNRYKKPNTQVTYIKVIKYN